MLKLLAIYSLRPTIENAQKVKAYANRHPMAQCLLDYDSQSLLLQAIRHATTGSLFAG